MWVYPKKDQSFEPVAVNSNRFRTTRAQSGPSGSPWKLGLHEPTSLFLLVVVCCGVFAPCCYFWSSSYQVPLD